MRILARVCLFALVGSACDGSEAPPACNEVCDSAARPVKATYVPYRWCDDIQAEADRIYGSYACISEEVDLRGEVVTMTVEASGAIEESLSVIGVVVDECVEVASWYVDITFTSEAFAVHLPSQVEVYELGDGDRIVLFDGPHPREDIDGWLLEGAEGDQNVDIYSATPVGEPGKRWTVVVGNYSDAVELTCE